VRRERIPGLLARVGIGHAADVRVGRYSKGMRQRAGIAQALIGDPDVLILDEPMSGLDPLGRKDVRDLILSLRDEGKTVLVTSHILADAEVICDQVAIILNGKIAHQGYLDQLLSQEVEGAELVVEGIDAELFEELKGGARRSVPQGTRFLFDYAQAADAEKAFDRVRERGGRIRSLVPKRRTLEDLMFPGAKKEETK
jgi:ABC-2 type transport system ATP-binding protein